MTPTRISTIAALAAMSAMAFIGTSTASATSTSLCKVHQEPCSAGNQVKSIHLVNIGNVVLKAKFLVTLTVECKKSLNKSSIGALGAPQVATIEAATVEECSTGGTLCSVETVNLGSFNILKTALNLGNVEAVNTQIHAKCASIVDCEYNANGKIFSMEGSGHTAGAGNGMITAKELVVNKVAGGFICPTEAKLTVLYETLEKVFLVS